MNENQSSNGNQVKEGIQCMYMYKPPTQMYQYKTNKFKYLRIEITIVVIHSVWQLHLPHS